jgi:hypothetical protein
LPNEGDDAAAQQEEDRLNALLRKAEALQAGGKSENERAVAEAAANRIRAKLLELKEQRQAAKRKASALVRSPTPIPAPARPPAPAAAPAAAPSPWSAQRSYIPPGNGFTPATPNYAAEPSSSPRRTRPRRPLPAERFQAARRSVVAPLGGFIVAVLVISSYAAIAVIAAKLAGFILPQRAPDIVRVSESILAAAFVLALLIVNWVRYWRSTPLRIQAAFYVLTLNGQTLVACLAVVGGISLGWASWNYVDQGNNAVAALGLLASGVALFIGGFYIVMAIGFSVYVVIFGMGEATRAPNLDTVRNQNADIDAGYADEDDVQRALGGASEDGQPRPYKYHD